MNIFQQYGPRRSGTNYIRALLQQNFFNAMVTDSMPWKHGYTKDPKKAPVFPEDIEYQCTKNGVKIKKMVKVKECNNISSLVTIKNPYSWIESLWRWSINSPETHNEEYMFFNPRSSYKIDDYEDATISSIDSYNQRFKHWIENVDEIVRYEDLLDNYENVLATFELKYKLHRSYRALMNIENGCDPVPLNHRSILPDWDYADYYLNNKYLVNLPPNIIDCITEAVDWTQFGKFGYEPI